MDDVSLIAVYEDAAAAHDAADLLRRNGFDDKDITLTQPRDDRVAAEAAQQEESDQLIFGPGPVLATRRTAWAAVVGAALGTLAGMVLGAIVWALWFADGRGDLDSRAWLYILLLSGGTGGMVAAGLWGFLGVSKQEERDENEAANAVVVLGVTPRDDVAMRRAEAILSETASRHVERARRPRSA